jgi:hypothetical protein
MLSFVTVVAHSSSAGDGNEREPAFGRHDR